MLQILSTSNETSTGPELVKNGNFSEVGSELIEDGNFPNGDNWTLGTGWTIAGNKASVDATATTALSQSPVSITNGKFYRVSLEITDYVSGFLKPQFGGQLIGDFNSNGVKTFYVKADGGWLTAFYLYALGTSKFSVSNVTVKEVGQDWTIGTGWSIGDSKAISAVTGSNSDITQSILTAGKTYQTVFEVVDYTAGTVQAVVTGDVGTDRTAVETYTESLTATGTNFSIRSKLGTFNGSVSSVSVKLLGTYDAQSIYVTAADVQTIAQASVYYLVELTSMASKNSIYFLPSSVVPNNGRYTKLNFTVISKDATPTPASGIISFYDSVGGFDTYPMGFYEFRIYEQTSSTNLNPLLATGLLEKGFAFVRDFSGNMQELTDGFKEYNPTLTQYVYSK